MKLLKRYNGAIKQISALFFSAFLVGVVAIPTAGAYPDSLKQDARNREYFNLNDACTGLTANDGVVCITEYPANEESWPFRRKARLVIDGVSGSFLTVELVEFEPNNADIALMFVINQHTITGFGTDDFPIVRAYLNAEGGVSIDTEYSSYSEEESLSNVASYEEELLMLMTALRDTRQ